MPGDVVQVAIFFVKQEESGEGLMWVPTGVQIQTFRNLVLLRTEQANRCSTRREFRRYPMFYKPIESSIENRLVRGRHFSVRWAATEDNLFGSPKVFWPVVVLGKSIPKVTIAARSFDLVITDIPRVSIECFEVFSNARTSVGVPFDSATMIELQATLSDRIY